MTITYERDGLFFREIRTYELKEVRQYSRIHNLTTEKVLSVLSLNYPEQRFLITTKLTSSQIAKLDLHFNIGA